MAAVLAVGIGVAAAAFFVSPSVLLHNEIRELTSPNRVERA